LIDLSYSLLIAEFLFIYHLIGGFQLKSIILAYTELKYQQQDIYQISSADIGRVLRELNENNNRLLEPKSVSPLLTHAPPASTTVVTTAAPTVLSAPARYQLITLPVSVQTKSSVQERTKVLSGDEVKLPLDHDYSIQATGRGPLGASGNEKADKATSVLKKDVATQINGVSGVLAGKEDSSFANIRYSY